MSVCEKKLKPLILWHKEKKIPEPLELAQVAVMSFDEIRACYVPEEMPHEALAIALALRIRYIKTRGDHPAGSDLDAIETDTARVEWKNHRFIAERLKGLESVLREMDKLFYEILI